MEILMKDPKFESNEKQILENQAQLDGQYQNRNASNQNSQRINLRPSEKPSLITPMSTHDHTRNMSKISMMTARKGGKATEEQKEQVKEMMKQIINSDPKTLTQDQLVRQEKMKKHVRENVYKYFRNISTSELKNCLLKWRAKV